MSRSTSRILAGFLCLAIAPASTQLLAQSAFKSGERVTYSMRYGIAKGAEIQFSSRDTVFRGDTRWHHYIVGKTTGLLGMLWPMKDQYHSLTDKANDMPLRAIRDVQEQKYLDYKVDDYDRTTRTDSVIVTRETGDKVVLPRNTHDMVSMAYYVRNRLGKLKIKPGQTIEIPTFFNAEFYPMRIIYKRDEVIKTRLGKMRCMVLVPIVQDGNVFEEKEAITMWFTKDKNHLPILVKFKFFLGTLTCEAEKFENLAWPLEVIMDKR